MILDLSAPSPVWAISVSGEVSPSRRPPNPELSLYAAVLEQAYRDALGYDGEISDHASDDARRFFRDWRVEAICLALSIPVDRVRADFERKLRQVRQGAKLRYRRIIEQARKTVSP